VVAYNSSFVQITLNGTGYDASFTATVGGVLYPMYQFVSATQYRIRIMNPAVWSAPAALEVCAVNGSGVASAPLVWKVVPLPKLNSVEPTSVPVNSPDTVITIRGENFTRDTKIMFKTNVVGSVVPTTFIDENKVTALLSASLLTAADASTAIYAETMSVQALKPIWFGVLTGSETPPVLNSVSPAEIPAGSSSYISCQVFGTGFDEATRVYMDGVLIPEGVWYQSTPTAQWLHFTPEWYAVPKRVALTMRHSVTGLASVGTVYLDMIQPVPGTPYVVKGSPAQIDVPRADYEFSAEGYGLDMTCQGKVRGTLCPATVVELNGCKIKFIVPAAVLTDPTGDVPITVVKGGIETAPFICKFI